MTGRSWNLQIAGAGTRSFVGERPLAGAVGTSADDRPVPLLGERVARLIEARSQMEAAGPGPVAIRVASCAPSDRVPTEGSSGVQLGSRGA